MWAIGWGVAAFAAEWFSPVCPDELPDCAAVEDLQEAVDGAADGDVVWITEDAPSHVLIVIDHDLSLAAWKQGAALSRITIDNAKVEINGFHYGGFGQSVPIVATGADLTLRNITASSASAVGGPWARITGGTLSAQNLHMTGVFTDSEKAMIEVQDILSLSVEDSSWSHTQTVFSVEATAAEPEFANIHFNNVSFTSISGSALQVSGSPGTARWSVDLRRLNLDGVGLVGSTFYASAVPLDIRLRMAGDTSVIVADTSIRSSVLGLKVDLNDLASTSAFIDTLRLSDNVSGAQTPSSATGVLDVRAKDVKINNSFICDDGSTAPLLQAWSFAEVKNSGLLRRRSRAQFAQAITAHKGLTIEHTVLGLGGAGVGFRDISIYNSYISIDGIDSYQPQDATLDWVAIHTPSPTDWTQSRYSLTNPLYIADPGFQNYVPGVTPCDEINLWLTADSPLRDAGNPDPAFNDPDGTRNDIGMFGGPGAPIVDADDDLTWEDLDCDDTDPLAFPGAPEIPYDAVDQDCDGADVNDADGDGYPIGVDCLDSDPLAYPGAPELWYDGVDQGCDGGNDYDQDGDGSLAVSQGGADCDDLDPTVSGGKVEIWYDGVDQNCDGNDADRDEDGHLATIDAFGAPIPGGDDCNDLDPGRNPSVLEVWYDDVDQDCDGNDDDQDLDGFGSVLAGGADCDDEDADVRPDATEDWYDGIDQDCDGADDYDQDGDGVASAAFGGEDCDDLDSALSPLNAESWYDGFDQDCDGADDYDQDGDGHRSPTDAGGQPVAGGDDCNDLLAAIHPGTEELWYDGVDQDCDGNDLDQDGDGHDALDHGGDDCDDQDARTYPGAKEDFGIEDRDCDGWYDPSGPVTPQDCDGCSTSGSATGLGWLLLVGAALRRRAGATRKW